MNKIELLPKDIKIGDKWYQPRIYLTAWGNWCIAYKDICNKTAHHLCSVCIEPNNEPLKIEDTIGCINEKVGNARTIDDAVDMIIDYINNKGYIK